MSLRHVLAVGGIYDLVFGLAILVFTHASAAILGLTVPQDPIYLYLNGVFLLILGAVYVAASREPGRYPAVAPISAAGRVLGFVLFAWAWRGGRSSTFLALGLADLSLGIATFAAWRRERLK
jgi:uncharacterized membrane protein